MTLRPLLYTPFIHKKDNYPSNCPPVRLFYGFFYLCLLTDTASQVVQLRAPYLTSSDHLNLLHIGGMYRPCLLNADTVGSLPDSESLTAASALSLQDNAFKYLNPLAVAFLDLTVHLYSVTYIEVINLLL